MLFFFHMNFSFEKKIKLDSEGQNRREACSYGGFIFRNEYPWGFGGMEDSPKREAFEWPPRWVACISPASS